MAKQLGRAMLVKIETTDGGASYTTVFGLNSKTLTINNTSIDVTTPDQTTPGGVLWTETLNGVKNIAVSGDGFFEDDGTADARVIAQAMAADNEADFQIEVPDLGTWTGNFRIASFEMGGETEGGVTFSISLESNGAITYTAA